MDLLSFQESQGINGPLLEIGIFMGRYLSVLIQSALRTGSKVVGIDTFESAEYETVLSGLRQHLPNSLDNLRLVKSFSSDFDSDGILDLLEGRPRFISVDGSHEIDDVFLDLGLCEQVLADRGIIAIDDFLNPVAIGVNQAINAFFRQPRRVVPFAYLPNKLMLCRPSQAQTFRDLLENITLKDNDEPHAAAFRAAIERGRQFAEQILFGYKVLIMS